MGVEIAQIIVKILMKIISEPMTLRRTQAQFKFHCLQHSKGIIKAYLLSPKTHLLVVDCSPLFAGSRAFVAAVVHSLIVTQFVGCILCMQA